MWRKTPINQTKPNQTYGRAPDFIDISYGSLTCPSKHLQGATFLYGYSEKPPH